MSVSIEAKSFAPLNEEQIEDVLTPEELNRFYELRCYNAEEARLRRAINYRH